MGPKASKQKKLEVNLVDTKKDDTASGSEILNQPLQADENLTERIETTSEGIVDHSINAMDQMTLAEFHGTAWKLVLAKDTVEFEKFIQSMTE